MTNEKTVKCLNFNSDSNNAYSVMLFRIINIKLPIN